MADIYRDFAYAMVTGFVSAAATSIPVDETDRLPSNAELAANDFWMTFESSYALDRFEIVRLVSKSVEVGAGTLVVVRGAQGSTAFDRSPGVVLKHAVTAEMLRLFVSTAARAGEYKRYVDLGNVTLIGTSQCFSDPTILRGVAAGQAGGATVVAGALIARGLEGSSAGSTTAGATLTIADPMASQSTAEVFGAQMFGT